MDVHVASSYFAGTGVAGSVYLFQSPCIAVLQNLLIGIEHSAGGNI